MTLVTPSTGEPGVRPRATRTDGPRVARRIGHGRVSLVLLPILALLLLLGLWWVSVPLFNISPAVLPGPPAVWHAFWAQTTDMLKGSWTTLVETLVGFVVATAVGWLVAVLVTASVILKRTVYPLLVALNAVPKVAVAPVFVLWLGFGMAPKVLLVASICFFPIVISAAAGLASTPPEMVELARSLEARPWKAYLKIRLPNALPQVFVGLKVGITLAVIGAVVAEFQSGADKGLGYITISASGMALADEAFAAVTLLSVMSILLFYVLVGVERLLLPWAAPARQNRS